MKRKEIISLFLVLAFALAGRSFAQEIPSATQIVKNSDDLLRGDSNQGTYTMSIVTPSWKRELTLLVYSLGRDKIFIRILAPDKEKGITTLRIKNEMWNYLPRVEKTIKIPPSLMLQPWMGSDFANEDLVKESSVVNDYDHRIIKEDLLEGQSLYVIESTPKPHTAIIWGKITRWIRKNDNICFKEEYYDEKGKLIKILEYSDIGPVSDRTIPRVWKMTPVNKAGYWTTIHLVDVKYNQPIDEQVFTLTNLKAQ